MWQEPTLMTRPSFAYTVSVCIRLALEHCILLPNAFNIHRVPSFTILKIWLGPLNLTRILATTYGALKVKKVTWPWPFQGWFVIPGQHFTWPTCIQKLTIVSSYSCFRWRGGATGRALNLRSTGRGFSSCTRGISCVTISGKLFTPMCLRHQAV